MILTKFEREVQTHLGPDSNAIVLPESTDSIALSNYIQGFFSASASFNEFGALLLSELEHQNKLINYLNLLSNYIVHPVAVYDSSFHVISHSTNAELRHSGRNKAVHGRRFAGYPSSYGVSVVL